MSQTEDALEIGDEAGTEVEEECKKEESRTSNVNNTKPIRTPRQLHLEVLQIGSTAMLSRALRSVLVAENTLHANRAKRE